MSDDDSDMIQKMFESCGVNVNFVDCGNEKESAVKEKKPSNKLSREEKIRIAALNAAVKWAICASSLDKETILNESDIRDSSTIFETYIRTGNTE